MEKESTYQPRMGQSIMDIGCKIENKAMESILLKVESIIKAIGFNQKEKAMAYILSMTRTDMKDSGNKTGKKEKAFSTNLEISMKENSKTD